MGTTIFPYFYLDLIENKFLACFKSCLNCKYYSDNCTECNKNYYPLEDISGKCLSNCPEEYFLDKNTNICKKLKIINQDCKINQVSINRENKQICIENIECIETAFINSSEIFSLADINYKSEFVLDFKKEYEEYSNLFLFKWENTKCFKEGKESNENDYFL